MCGSLRRIEELLNVAPSSLETKGWRIILAVSVHAVSLVLDRIADSTKKLVYYVSRTLEDAETRYSDVEKLALALFMSSKKLRLYLQSHIIIVAMSYPLRAILHSPNVVRRLMKWLVALSEFHIVYRPRTTFKAQVIDYL